MKKYLFSIIYGIVLALFTAYVALDSFVLKMVPKETVVSEVRGSKTEMGTASDTTVLDTPVPEEKREVPDEKGIEEIPEEPESTPSPTPTPIVPTWTDDSYMDENMEIRIQKYREYDSDLYVVDIKLSSPEFLKTALAADTEIKGRKSNWADTSQIAGAREGLIVAVNGDCWASRNGYAIKNGILLRDKITRVTKGLALEEPDQEDLVIFKDGSSKIVREGDFTAQELLENGVVQLFNFGPALISQGANVSETSVSTSNVADSRNPRTAIGQIDELHYVFIVVDGRSWTKTLNYMSRGVTCAQLAEFGMKLGIQNLYNLDGGGSSTLYFNGRVVNNPCRNGKEIKEETVSDIVYIGY